MYIRTSYHEILNVFEKKASKFIGGVWYICKNHKEIHSDFVIKEADTIEELCDEFVLKNEKITKLWLYETYDLINEYSRESLPHKYVVYGAIWTSKGLIYVAKMNEKGELELC